MRLYTLAAEQDDPFAKRRLRLSRADSKECSIGSDDVNASGEHSSSSRLGDGGGFRRCGVTFEADRVMLVQLAFCAFYYCSCLYWLHVYYKFSGCVAAPGFFFSASASTTASSTASNTA
jgi:hypothetical protein